MRHAFAFAVLLSSIALTPTALIAQEYDHNATFDYYYYNSEFGERYQVGYAMGQCSGPNGPPISVMKWGYETLWYERVYVGQCLS